MSPDPLYDLIVLGGGPAGVSAAIYGARAGLSVILLEKMLIGGRLVSVERIENYPGFPEGISGPELGLLLDKQLRSFEVRIEASQAEQVSFKGELKKVFTPEGEFNGRAVVIATGTMPKLLQVEGEEDLRGRGISHCASCDAAFFRGKGVAVVGGSSAALEETLFIARFAAKVYLIHNRDTFRAPQALQERIFALPNVEIIWNSTVQKIEGEQKVTGVRLLQEDHERELAVDGIFVLTGRIPSTDFLRDELSLDESGYIITNELMETSQSRVYAAGDVRRTPLRQIITAAADGAIAATAAARSLNKAGAGES
ncbi:MAG TPA: FAD-dependent oxidoreductase [Bacillota bacterium]|jgi:thioredoxin reductase (NADPH)|nr:FAD-dependent oxidoreductase [Bacillota bacterium]HOA35287.1 FAD-dependent oxidoreductase [Bacillota bacterium]HOJ83489.1 FAD-dependent oxidoreductase [Bacillota bacterium]HOL14833.1 FAD-dependent oxidoreductase [Bacillota bacterium]HPZ11283.1 FAD-dependent oxidoreductase [Bacillota bacterium]